MAPMHVVPLRKIGHLKRSMAVVYARCCKEQATFEHSPLELPREENLGVIGGILLMIRCCVFSSVEIVRTAGARTKAKKPAVWGVKSKFPCFPS
jgi:hypothetical protein